MIAKKVYHHLTEPPDKQYIKNWCVKRYIQAYINAEVQYQFICCKNTDIALP